MGHGLFIVFEGGDGAGKSTQVRLLAEALQQGNIPTLVTREPGGTPVGQQIRELLLHGEELDARAEALLFAADRAHHVHTLVRPALAAGKTVVQDRYIDSSVAYQSASGKLSATEVAGLSDWATQHLTPDLTVLLDIPAALSQERLRSRGEAADRMESKGGDFHNRVREILRQRAAADPQRYLVLDASETPAELAEKVLQRVREEILQTQKH